MCETWTEEVAWTLPSDMCEFELGYDDPRYNLTTINANLPEACIFLLKCALTNGFEVDCPCGRNATESCFALMTIHCSDTQEILFPSKGLIRPYLLMFYKVKQSYEDKKPATLALSGSIQCVGYRAESLDTSANPIYLTLTADFVINYQKDFNFCQHPLIQRNKSSAVKYFPSNCWNDSAAFSNRPHSAVSVCPGVERCYSVYREKDSNQDCPHLEDENNENSIVTCAKLKQHRFRCSTEQPTCLLVEGLFNQRADCDNKFDHYAYGNGRLLREYLCKHKNDEGCNFLKAYIKQSWINQTEPNENRPTVKNIRYRDYCDSHWDVYPAVDEETDFCKEWICSEGMFRCKTHQCIPKEWVCDGEWDCSDASDEQGIFIYEDVWTRNTGISNLRKLIDTCVEVHKIQPFSDIYNVSVEFPCLITDVKNPLDIDQNRPCIDLTLIGDGIEHCYGGLDERNTALGCLSGMKGFDYHCSAESKRHCISYMVLCDDFCLKKEDKPLCFYKSVSDACRGPSDVLCFNGTCMPNARCNGKNECEHGEDEFWCPYIKNQLGYRLNKRRELQGQTQHINWITFPNKSIEHILPVSKSDSLPRIDRAKMKRHLNDEKSNAFICNRGLAVQFVSKTKCFCSGTYYGDKCQFFADRITIVTHLNLTDTAYRPPLNKTIVIKIIAYFLFEENDVLDIHEFHVTPAIEYIDYVKHKFQLVYSRSERFLEHKQQRYFNRSDIIHFHPYSVKFDMFELQDNQTVEVATWKYLIYFDFLPAFRLAKVLRFPPIYLNGTYKPCSNVTCNSNSQCIPLFIDDSVSYFCTCKSGYYGLNCQLFDAQCLDYCSVDSICRPDVRPILSGNREPLCICPLNRFGPRCNLKHEHCQTNPCKNQAICYHTFDPSGMDPFVCICSKYFYGKLCEYGKSATDIRISNFSTADHALAMVVQYYDVDYVTLELLLRHQEVISSIPSYFHSRHAQDEAPVLGILKLYISLTEDQYYILYIQPRISIVNITVTPQYCPHTSLLIETGKLMNDTTKSANLFRILDDGIPPVFKYQRLCRQNSSQFCFHDSIYFCICQPNGEVDCFNHNPLIDQCSSCLSRGKCVQGVEKDPNDFICLCPYCYSGRLCEFSMQPFSVTLDSLLAFNRASVQWGYVSVVIVFFIIGCFTNFCSLVTFKRSTPRQISVGNWLFLITLINQCALAGLLTKFIQIYLGSSFGWTSNASCKVVNYILVVSARSTYWLTSWITVNRLLIAIFPTTSSIKTPCVAFWSSVITILLLMISHVHEILYSISIHAPQSIISFCVVDFEQQSALSQYNRINTLFHSVTPFLIQMISITVLLIYVTKHRMAAKGQNTVFKQTLKTEFLKHKELYVTPITLVLSVLPQTILAFSFICAQLDSWQQHSLLIAYMLSYTPQVLGFLLFVLPSSVYKKEFLQTVVGQRLQECYRTKRRNL